MLKTVKALVYRAVWNLGYDIRRKPEVDRHMLLKALPIETILDIGANEGQFAERIRGYFPKAVIYSFEPLQECYETLVARHADDRRFHALNLALSDTAGEVTFRRSPFSQASSMLAATPLADRNFPFAAGETLVTVRADTLDSVAATLDLGRHLLVKIDVQGVEGLVLSGGRSTISRADVVILETNFQQLYIGQLFFKAALDRMYDLGFRYLGNLDNQLLSPLDGTCLEEDSVFVNERLLSNEGNYVGV